MATARRLPGAQERAAGLAAGPGRSTRGIAACCKRLAREADDTLKALWDAAGLPAGFALLAVGGFGRGELFPHSDVDVLVLMPDGTSRRPRPRLKRRIEAFIGNCWDAGLEIGSSVRTVSECVAQADKRRHGADLAAGVAAGHRRRASSTRLSTSASAPPSIPQAFFVAKTLEMRQRHTKFENTPYSLEPNCKESPGGLRDLQVILWVAKAAGFGKSWDELARNGLATAFEARQIKRNEALLSLIRARLHVIANRREDRLVFDLQTAVAESFGYETAISDRRPRAGARQRGADEALLLGGQGGDPAQPDPAAQHRGAAQSQRARAAADQRALLRTRPG